MVALEILISAAMQFNPCLSGSPDKQQSSHRDVGRYVGPTHYVGLPTHLCSLPNSTRAVLPTTHTVTDAQGNLRIIKVGNLTLVWNLKMGLSL